MVLAGPVFPEWYWGPIFFVLFFSPVIAAVGALINWRARRIATVRRWATTHVRRYALAVTSLVLAALLIAGALDWWRARAFERENHANAARLPFQPLAPLRTPAGY